MMMKLNDMFSVDLLREEYRKMCTAQMEHAEWFLSKFTSRQVEILQDEDIAAKLLSLERLSDKIKYIKQLTGATFCGRTTCLCFGSNS